MSPPRFPGATEFSLVSLYDTLGTPCCGGTPHIHTACSEAYIGLSGEAHVDTLSSEGPQSHRLTPGMVVWFMPGVIHRGVPDSGRADVLVLMQNAGLPEAGDAVVTLPSRFWSEPENYAATVSIEADTFEEQLELVRRRRDLAMEGYEELLEMHDAEGAPGLREFFDYACAVVAPEIDTMLDLVRQTAEREVRSTVSALERMQLGNFSHLLEGRAAHATCETTRLGMCGNLRPFRSTNTEHGA